MVNLLFNVTIYDISAIYVTAHRCAGGLKKKFKLNLQVEHKQVPKGRDQVSGGVSVPCRHATPFANVQWKPLKIR